MPTSPALANLTAFRLDARLSGLARAAGARYTRYADDLVFSGPRRLVQPSFRTLVERIARDEGFEVHPGKTRAMPRSQRQQVLGVVVKERPALARHEYERLEATLFNCAQRPPGPGWQVDLRKQLEGRVAWARQIDPHRAARLVELFESIEWGHGD